MGKIIDFEPALVLEAGRYAAAHAVITKNFLDSVIADDTAPPEDKNECKRLRRNWMELGIFDQQEIAKSLGPIVCRYYRRTRLRRMVAGLDPMLLRMAWVSTNTTSTTATAPKTSKPE